MDEPERSNPAAEFFDDLADLAHQGRVEEILAKFRPTSQKVVAVVDPRPTRATVAFRVVVVAGLALLAWGVFSGRSLERETLRDVKAIRRLLETR